MNIQRKEVPIFYKTKNKGFFKFDSKEKVDDSFTNYGMFPFYPQETLRDLFSRLLALQKLTKLKSHDVFTASLFCNTGRIFHFSNDGHPLKDNMIGIRRDIEYEQGSSSSIIPHYLFEFFNFNTPSKDLYFYNRVDKIIIW